MSENSILHNMIERVRYYSNHQVEIGKEVLEICEIAKKSEEIQELLKREIEDQKSQVNARNITLANLREQNSKLEEQLSMLAWCDKVIQNANMDLSINEGENRIIEKQRGEIVNLTYENQNLRAELDQLKRANVFKNNARLLSYKLLEKTKAELENKILDMKAFERAQAKNCIELDDKLNEVRKEKNKLVNEIYGLKLKIAEHKNSWNRLKYELCDKYINDPQFAQIIIELIEKLKPID